MKHSIGAIGLAFVAVAIGVAVAAAEGRSDTLLIVVESGPNSLDIHGVGANRPAYGASWNLYDRLITYVTDRPGHDKRYAIDASKLETHLGWRAQENFETGIKKTVQWYLERPDWWKPLRETIYRGERLGI